LLLYIEAHEEVEALRRELGTQAIEQRIERLLRCGAGLGAVPVRRGCVRLGHDVDVVRPGTPPSAAENAEDLVIGEQRDEAAERSAQRIPGAQGAGVVVEEREEHLLREVFDLLRDVPPLAARAAPAHEGLRHPSVNDRTDALHERTNRLGLPGDRTRDEVGVGIVHGAVVPQLVRPRRGWYDAVSAARMVKATTTIPRARLLALVLALVLVSGCNKPAPPPPPPDAPLAALVSGCAALVADPSGSAPVCTPPADGRVRLYVPCEGADRVDIEVPGGAPTPAPKNVAGGRLFTLTVPKDARTITVRRTDAGSTRAVYTQPLAARPRPAWFDEAQSLRQKGELDAAEARATAASTAPTATDEDRALGEGLLARIALRRGKVDVADRHFRAAIDLDKRTGRISDRADDAFALVFLLHQRSRHYPEARRVLDEVAGDLAAYPDGRAREPLYRGQVAWEAGDTRTALRLLAVAIDRADRLGADGIARAARQVRGMVMCNAGTTQSCVATLREAERELGNAEGVTSCERAELAMGLGYAELEAISSTSTSASATSVERAGEADQRALGYLDQGCPDAYLRTVALEHLALAEVLRNRPREAEQRLAQAKAGTNEPRISDALFWTDVEARIAMLDHKPDVALAAFEIERTRAIAAQRDGEVWRALVGRGRVLEDLGKTSDALEAYRAADDVIEDAIVAVPFGEGRSSVSAESRDGTNRAAALLSKLGRDAEALDVVRRARSRLVRSLARAEQVAALSGADRERWERAIADYRTARDDVDGEAAGDWKKARPALEAAIAARKARHAKLRSALDDAMALVGAGGARGAGGTKAQPLPALPSGELVLAYVDLGGVSGGGVVGFAVEAGKTRAFRVGVGARGGIDGDAGVRDGLLAPVAPEIERATRIHLLTEGALAAIDVHALTWKGMPLVAHVPVVYGLDLGPATHAATGRAALVVADPTGDLPSSRDEGNAALAQLAKHYDARKLTGSDATAAHVREALAGLAFLHYAGHGVFAGREGAESALPLAQGGALTVGDVLAMRGAPERVVLSGCEAGRQLGAREEGAAGIASAFLVAGAIEVVAPVRVVDDRAASGLSRDLHAALDAKGDRDLAAALQSAQVRSFREGRAGWEAFRVFAR
jgi:tetratricopeptide (TPR) repeat protein